MTPLSKNAIFIFGLISANASKAPMHINILFRLAQQPKSQVEVAMIELMAQDYIQYDIPTQFIYIKRRRHDKSTDKSKPDGMGIPGPKTTR